MLTYLLLGLFFLAVLAFIIYVARHEEQRKKEASRLRAVLRERLVAAHQRVMAEGPNNLRALNALIDAAQHLSAPPYTSHAPRSGTPLRGDPVDWVNGGFKEIENAFAALKALDFPDEPE